MGEYFSKIKRVDISVSMFKIFLLVQKNICNTSKICFKCVCNISKLGELVGVLEGMLQENTRKFFFLPLIVHGYSETIPKYLENIFKYSKYLKKKILKTFKIL